MTSTSRPTCVLFHTRAQIHADTRVRPRRRLLHEIYIIAHTLAITIAHKSRYLLHISPERRAGHRDIFLAQFRVSRTVWGLPSRDDIPPGFSASSQPRPYRRFPLFPAAFSFPFSNLSLRSRKLAHRQFYRFKQFLIFPLDKWRGGGGQLRRKYAMMDIRVVTERFSELI